MYEYFLKKFIYFPTYLPFQVFLILSCRTTFLSGVIASQSKKLLLAFLVIQVFWAFSFQLLCVRKYLYFTLIFDDWFFWFQNAKLTVFFFQQLKMFHCLLDSIILDESAIIHIIVPLYIICLFSLVAFKIFCLSLLFSSLTMM